MEQCFSVLQHANDTLCGYDNTHMQHSPSQNQKKNLLLGCREKNGIIKPECPK